MGEVIQAAGYAAIVYVMFNSLISFGSGRPLVEWINPGRRYIPVLAIALVGSAAGFLKLASRKYQVSYAELMHRLLSQEKAPPEVIGAVSFVVFALVVMMVGLWCYLKLPRAATSFNPAPRDIIKEYRRALRHYVRWPGGMDYAMLCESRDGQLVEIASGSDDRSILQGLNRLPGLPTIMKGRGGKADVEAQKQLWRDLAARVLAEWPRFDELVFPVRHGHNAALTFDLRHGAIFIEMVEDIPAPPGGYAVNVCLFAVVLNQHEMNTMTAHRHFAGMSQAIRHIRTGVAKR